MQTETFSTADSSQIFDHFTKELNNFYLDAAKKTADKVNEIFLKFTIYPLQTVEDKENPEVLRIGEKPIWTKAELSFKMRLFVKGQALAIDGTRATFKEIRPHFGSASKVSIEAEAHRPPNVQLHEALPITVAEKTWVYLIKK